MLIEGGVGMEPMGALDLSLYGWFLSHPTCLLQDKSLINWYLLVSELVSMGPDLSCRLATGTNSCI